MLSNKHYLASVHLWTKFSNCPLKKQNFGTTISFPEGLEDTPSFFNNKKGIPSDLNENYFQEDLYNF